MRNWMYVKINTIKYKTGNNTVIIMHDKRYLCLVIGTGVVFCCMLFCVMLCCVVCEHQKQTRTDRC